MNAASASGRAAGQYLGPYERWSWGAGRPYAFPAIRGEFRHVGALAELPAPAPPPGSHAPGVLYPTLWRDGGLFRTRFLPFVMDCGPGVCEGVAAIGAGAARCATALAPSGGGQARFRVNFPVADETLDAGFSRAPAAPASAAAATQDQARRPVVVAVIDDGIPFAHANFRGPGGSTRIDHCWVQSARCEPGGDVLFGREFDRAAIDGLVAAFGHDEDLLYRRAGVVQTLPELGPVLNRPATHGSLVLDMAAGSRPEQGETGNPDIRIVAVQLPNTIAWDTSGFGKDMFMLSALHYVFDRADRIAARLGLATLPLVVNFSYGFSGGPHDGASELEAAMDELVAARRRRAPTALVMPSGNTFSDRLHARIDEPGMAGGSASLTWRLQPNDRTSSFLEVWFPHGFDPAGYEMQVEAPPVAGLPGPAATIPLNADPHAGPGDPRRFVPLLDGRGNEIGQLSVDRHRHGAGGADVPDRWRAMVALAPSEPDDPALPRIAAGAWTIRLRRVAGAAPLPEQGPVMCWIQRDADPLFFLSGSRQSYFDDPANVAFDPQGRPMQTDSSGSPVRRFGSLSGLATGSLTTVISGYCAGAEAPQAGSLPDAAPTSSAGPDPALAGLPAAVAACAPSERMAGRFGVVGAGTRSGGLAALTGTSIASPLAARMLARAFADLPLAQVEAATSGNYADLLEGNAISEASPGARARFGRIALPERPRETAPSAQGPSSAPIA